MTQQLHVWAFLPEKWKFTFMQKFNSNAYSSFIHGSRKPETNSMSIKRHTVKSTVVRPPRGQLLSTEKARATEPRHNLGEP